MRNLVAIATVVMLIVGIYFLQDLPQNRSGVQEVGAPPRATGNESNPDAATTDWLSDRPDAQPPEPIDARSSANAVAVNWRPRPAGALDWNEYREQSYDELRTLAESGDAQAAVALARRLKLCDFFAGAAKTDAEIDAAIEEMRRSYKVPAYRDGVPEMMDFINHPDSLDSQIDNYEKYARTCSTVTLQQRDEWQDWANRALATGIADLPVQNLMLESMTEDDFLRFVSDIWNAGEPTALFSLSAIHHKAYWEAHDAAARTRAYAYDLASFMLMKDYYDEFDVPLDQRGLGTLEGDLVDQRRRMHAYEVREAEKLAREIIEKNPNCCLAWPGYVIDIE